MPRGTKPVPIGTQTEREDGYIAVKVSEHKWDLLHRIKWALEHGPIPKGYVVHHIDENPRNNELSNLELKPSQAAHLSHHMKGKPKSPEHRAKIAAALRGKKKSPEHVRNWKASRWG